MELAKLIVPSKTIWIEYPGKPDFEVQLSYLTRDELMKIRSKAMTNKIDKRTRGVVEEIDNELFQQLYIKAVIKGWKGLKYEYLRNMVPVDLSEIETDDDNKYIGELEYTATNAEVLMKNVSGFDSWITDVLDDVENFTKNS